MHMSSSAQATQLPIYINTASFMCTLQVRFLSSSFPIVSVAVWITVFARFDRCLNLFSQQITKHWSTPLELFFLEVSLKGPLFLSFLIISTSSVTNDNDDDDDDDDEAFVGVGKFFNSTAVIHLLVSYSLIYLIFVIGDTVGKATNYCEIFLKCI